MFSLQPAQRALRSLKADWVHSVVEQMGWATYSLSSCFSAVEKQLRVPRNTHTTNTPESGFSLASFTSLEAGNRKSDITICGMWGGREDCVQHPLYTLPQ